MQEFHKHQTRIIPTTRQQLNKWTKLPAQSLEPCHPHLETRTQGGISVDRGILILVFSNQSLLVSLDSRIPIECLKGPESRETEMATLAEATKASRKHEPYKPYKKVSNQHKLSSFILSSSKDSQTPSKAQITSVDTLPIISTPIVFPPSSISSSLFPTYHSHAIPPKATQQPILILGAGISNLALAQCLLKSNIPFRIYERNTHFSLRAQGYRVRIIGTYLDALQNCLTTGSLFPTRSQLCHQCPRGYRSQRQTQRSHRRGTSKFLWQERPPFYQWTQWFWQGRARYAKTKRHP